jgi:outer membrane lipopolysaccharide assembly protein LptE/RlpB
MEHTMHKFLLVLAVATLTACGGSLPIDETTTADSTAVVADTAAVVADSTDVDSTAK